MICQLRMRKEILMTVLFAAILVFAATARAQEGEARVHWLLTTPHSKQGLKPGSRFNAELTAKIDSGWHLYSITQPPGGPIATVISLPEDQPFSLSGPVRGPSPKSAFDTAFGITTEFYEEEAKFAVPIKVGANVRHADQKLLVRIIFQACNDRLCLPPKTVKVEAPVRLLVAP